MAVLNTDKPHAGLIVQHAGQAESIFVEQDGGIFVCKIWNELKHMDIVPHLL